VEVTLAEDVPRASPDALRLLNLALNAIEASDAGGKVRLLASAGAPASHRRRGRRTRVPEAPAGGC
jgi:hypothetical protein